MNKNHTYKNTAATYLTPNYGERQIVMSKAEGPYMWDVEGNQYIDFLSGIGVTNLGHCPTDVVAALCEQAHNLMHCSNLYLIPKQIELSEMLCNNSFADRAFFCNSGAEANEAAIKIARRYSKMTFERDDRYHIVTMRNSFHGRTMATLTATGQEKVQKTFEPLVPGFSYATFNDFDSVVAQCTEHTCAVMVEPIQGEGGVIAASQEFLEKLRAFCTEKKMLLIFDEVQCGMGRTCKLFAHEHYNVFPDVMTLAKGLGNGFPIGSMLAIETVGSILTAGSHGTTFGGNPIACATAVQVMKRMTDPELLSRAQEMSEYLRKSLSEKLLGCSAFKGITGCGLMIGVQLNMPGMNIVKRCAAEGLIVNCTANTVIRLLPPLIIDQAICDKAVEILSVAIKAENANQAQ